MTPGESYSSLADVRDMIDAMSREILAVNKVSDWVLLSPFLEPTIATHDSVPFVDGTVSIYTDKSPHARRNFVGNVAVQVKGRTIKKKDKAPKSFSMELVELKGFLAESGVLYLVVFMRPDGKHRKLYFALLNPFKIQEILDTVPPGSKSVSVPLRRAPKSREDIEGLFYLAYESRLQQPGAGLDSRLLESPKSMTLHTSTSIDFSKPVNLNYRDHDYSVTLESSGGLKIPISGEFTVTPASYVSHPTELAARSGSFHFTNIRRKRVNEHVVEFELSKGLRFELPTDGLAGKTGVTLDPRTSLQGWVEDVGFYLAFIDTGVIQVGEATFTSASPNQNFGEDLLPLRKQFELASKFQALCTELQADANLLEIAQISRKRASQLIGLYEVFTNALEHPQTTQQPGRLTQPIGPWRFELCGVEGSRDGFTRIEDLFSPSFSKQIFERVGTEFGEQYLPITSYDLVSADNIPFTLNLHLDNVVNAYARAERNPRNSSRATYFVMALIRAASTVPARADEFLHAAARLNDWLIDSDKSRDRSSYFVNRWQIIARQGELSQEEKSEVRKLKHQARRQNSIFPDLLEASCAVLLRELDEAQFCLAQASIEDQETFKGWPIWDLLQIYLEDGVHALSQ